MGILDNVDHRGDFFDCGLGMVASPTQAAFLGVF